MEILYILKWMPIKHVIITSYLIFQTLHFQDLHYLRCKFLIPIPKLQFWNWNEAQSIKGISQQKEEKKMEKTLDVIVPQISTEGTFPELVPTACQHSGVSAQGEIFHSI